MINYQISFLIAVFSFVYCIILTEENAVLNGFYNFLYNLFKTDERAFHGKKIHPLFMILIHCSKCNSGQIAFWSFFFIESKEYNFMLHAFFVSFTIFTTAFITEFYKLIKHKNT